MVALPAFTAIPHPEIDTLVAGAAAGDVACFDALYRRDAERVYNLVLRSCGDADEAEDVCQEVWTRAHRSLHSLRDAGAFDTWVLRIAARACIDASRRRRASFEDETKLMALEGGSDASEEVEKQEQRRLAWQALGALPQRQRVALYLREVDGMRYADIAEAIGATPAAVETLLFRARHALAQAYGRLADSPDERCRRARHLMAVVLDGEGDAAEQRSLRAHLGDCHACQRQMFALNRGKRTYAALPFLAASGGLAPVLLPAAGAGVGGAGALLGLARLGALLSKATSLVVPAVTAATLTAAGVVAVTPLQDLVAGSHETRASESLSTSPSQRITASDAAPASVSLLDGTAQPLPLPFALPVEPGTIPAAPAMLAQQPLPITEPVQPPVQPPLAPQLQDSAPPVLTELLRPGVPLPQLTSLPQVTTPVITVPSVTLPALTTPGLALPPVSTQPIALPAVQLPSVAGLPNLTLPPVTVPTVTTVPVTLPPVTVPPVTLPSVQLPQLTTPANTQTVPKLPVALPPVALPPTLGLPLGR